MQENSIVGRLKGVWASIKRHVVPDDENTSDYGDLTNQNLVDMAEKAFVKKMRRESMKNTMVVPGCFYIDMADIDFLKMKQSFPLIVIELKGRLLDIIEREKPKYITCKHDKQWYFEFRTIEHIDTPDIGDIKEGQPNIRVQLRGRRKSTDTSPSDTDPNRTFNPKDDLSPEDRFESGMWENGRVFTPLYGRLASADAFSHNRNFAGSKEDVYAVLEENGNKFFMEQQEMHISGKNDRRNLPKTIWKLNVDLTPSKYAVIKYRPDKKQKFSIEAYGQLLLNGKSIEQGKLYQLFTGSIISIPTSGGNPIKIKFTTTKS